MYLFTFLAPGDHRQDFLAMDSSPDKRQFWVLFVAMFFGACLGFHTFFFFCIQEVGRGLFSPIKKQKGREILKIVVVRDFSF